MTVLILFYIFPSFQQIVDANVNYNAREGRSTVEVLPILFCLFHTTCPHYGHFIGCPSQSYLGFE
jgi:hypothetical protein